jgi:hypothetical protein
VGLPFKNVIKRMEHLDLQSIKGFVATILLGIFSHFTTSEVVNYLTIVVAITTIILNIIKMVKKEK